MADPPEAEIRQFLEVPHAQLMKEQSAAFDAKKTCWVPFPGIEGYAMVEVVSAEGDNVTVQRMKDKQEMTVPKDQCEQMNPPKYEKCMDMANLTYLNEASVLYNLRARYEATLIYTYSGLFCIAVNPYRRLPIYNDTCIKLFRGKRKIEMPPHLFAIVDNAYQNMLQEHDNQSMLITGESGAGKTENTKKVVMYIAKVAGNPKKADAVVEAGKIAGSLDEQIVEANPLMEAFGNAKTVRNNNSSRFGKFIRAHFSNTGKLAGADIESYLLEKNRVTFQLAAERNYHIFYQLLYATDDALLASLCLPSRISADYAYLVLGVPDVIGIDDHEEFGLTENSFVVLGFTPEERVQVYQITAALLHISNIKMKNNRSEQAEIIDPIDGERVSHLLGLNASAFHKSLIKPRVKVGTEFVNKGQSLQQVNFAVNALSKMLFERMFLWQVMRINQALDTKERRAHFIGVLDIAGFEIFEFNSFDQLCINVTNEKLQQFFNHTMFVLEQEEYKKEGLVWDTIDFAMDLELTIQLIMDPGGIFPMLEEECIVPKATDETYLGKLTKAHAGKHKSYGKPAAKDKGKNGDFILHHYAGSVGYHVAGWLEKNKDPVNEDTAGNLATGSNALSAHLFAEYNPNSKSKRKGSAFQTVSYKHREALKVLLATLGATTPHFVRCIIPNETKTPGEIWGDLVLHQLRCNGVLEGIRICRKGFPSRMPFNDFKQRYSILAASAIPTGFVDGKVASTALIEALQLDQSEYRIGHTKVFFRSGIVGELEDMRDERLSKILSQFQAYCKGNLQRKEYQKMRERKVGLRVMQRNVRKYIQLKDWSWWKLWGEVRPMLALASDEADMQAKEEELKKAQEKAAADAAAAADLSNKVTDMMANTEKLVAELNDTAATLATAEETLMGVQSENQSLQNQLDEALEKLEEEEGKNMKLGGANKDSKAKLEGLSTELSDAKSAISKLESEKSSRDKTIESMGAEIATNEATIAKLGGEKKNLEENLASTTEALQAAEDKGRRLGKDNSTVEGKLSDMTGAFNKEKDAKAKLDKDKKKVEGTLRDTEAALMEAKHDLEEAKDIIGKRDKALKEAIEGKESRDGTIKGLQKKVAELAEHITELEDEVDGEKKNKKKMEAAKAEAEADMEAMAEKLDEAGGATVAQGELVKKRDADIGKLRKDIEANTAAGEAALAHLKSKMNAAVAEAGDEIEAVKKTAAKAAKDKAALQGEFDDQSALLESTKKKAAQLQKAAKAAEDKVKAQGDMIHKLEEEVTEAAGRPSGTVDEATLAAATEEVEHKLGIAQKNVKTLVSQLEEAKDFADGESRGKVDAQQKLKRALDELESLAEALEEEQAAKSALQQKFSKAAGEAQSWKTKYDMEGASRVEELEDAKRKLAVRVQEMEQALGAAETKAASMEKVKNRMNEEVEDLLLDLERAQAQAFGLEKKQKKVDAQIGEWKAKCDEIQAESDKAQRDARNYSTELLKLRAAHEDATDKLDALKKENRVLSAELSSVTDQLSEGGKASHEIEKMRRKLEMEKEELGTALEEAETALEIEEGKLLKIQLEYTQLKQSSDRKLGEKEEEIESLRKNHQRQIASMTHMMETQNKGGVENAKIRKRLEDHIAELEGARDGAFRETNDYSKTNKKLAASVKELQGLLEDESRGRDDMREAASRAERRANDLAVQLDEARLALDQGERAKKAALAEKSEASDRVAELQAMYNNISNAKRKAEADYQGLQDEIEELENAKIASEEKGQRAAAEGSRLAAELVAAQESAGAAEKSREAIAKTVSDLTSRAEEAEAGGGKDAKFALRKYEQRISELESDLDTEARKGADAVKAARKADKRVKELQFLVDDSAKSSARTDGSSDKMNEKLRKMRLQLEDAEAAAASLGAKYKKAASDLEAAEERCEAAEAALSKARSRSVAGSRMRTPAE
jgi:myosin heavy chain 6/7